MMISKPPTWAIRTLLRCTLAAGVLPRLRDDLSRELWLRVGLAAQVAREEAARLDRLGEWAYYAPGGVA